MDNEQEAETLLNSADWLTNEADKLIALYKSCRTAHEQRKLIPKIEYMKSRLDFEKRQIEKILGV